MINVSPDFVTEYQHNVQSHLSKTDIGGTDWRFANDIAPSFHEIIEICKPMSVLEIGFNAGCSALMFLSIRPTMYFDSVDIIERKESSLYLSDKFINFNFYHISSSLVKPCSPFRETYDLVFIDGNHEYDAVISDIETSLSFQPEYILLDDFRHPSHSYIETIVTEDYKDKLEVVKVYEFNQCWHGYSMALCKVIK